MSIVDRISAETRAIGGVPWQPWLNPYWKFNIGGPVHPSRQVEGADSALALGAVYSAVRYLADAVASLPVQTYRKTPDGRPQRVASSQLLDHPSVGGTAYDWLFMAMTSLLLYGNAWGYITSRTGVSSPDGFNYPQTIEWLPPDRVTVLNDEQQPYNPLRSKVYFMGREMERSELFHIRAFVVPGRVEGISPLRAFAQLIGQGKDALKYSADWFHNGGFPPGTFQNTSEEVDADSAKAIRRMLTDTIRSREPLVYGRDWDYKPLVVPADEAVFVRAMQLNAAQIAAIYGVPPELVGGTRGDSLTYSTVQEETISLITNTLRPWLVRWEHALFDVIPQTQYVRFNADALLKTDLLTRHKLYEIDRRIGLRTADEMRELDDLPPLDGKAGTDNLPLELSVGMARSVRAVPKVLADQVELMEAAPGENDVTGEKPVASDSLIPTRSAEPDPPVFAPPHVRCSGAERQRACRWLAAAGEADCLTDDMLTERLLKAQAAHLRGQLQELVGDLASERELSIDAETRPAPGGGDRPPAPLFGPAAIALLHARSIPDDRLAPSVAAMNGKAH